MAELLCEFTVHGDPKPKGRPRMGKYGAYTPRATQDAERAVIDAFELACPLWEPSIERLRVEADFYRKGLRKVDTDNCGKLLLDALNGVLYVDDEQVDEQEFKRRYQAGDEARTVVRVWILED